MRQRVFTLAAMMFLIMTVIGLNVVSHTQKDTLPDTESNAKRSTFNAGATGTRALYEFLAETGKKVTRRQKSLITIHEEQDAPDTIVIVGDTLFPIDDKEAESLFKWVANGGKLVLIDREPNAELLKSTANWKISAVRTTELMYDVDPSDQRQMTDKTAAAKPVQPSLFTQSVTSVQPSRFASSSLLENFSEPPPKKTPPPAKYNHDDEPPPSKAVPPKTKIQTKAKTADDEEFESIALNAPFVHLANDKKRILVDFPFGEGQIVWLTDPYIVSNSGIGIVDNLQLALNIIGNDGVIAFDEYHHGYGEGKNQLLGYFAETPVFPIIGQIILLAFLILVSQSRRFARPLPEVVPSRISKLEYVSAFAELQQRTKAYDLAIENIYTDFRRKAARLFGADNFTIKRKELAEKISERGKFDELEIYNLMRRCEEIIQGDKTNKKEVLRLTTRIREIEDALNLKRTRLTIRS